MPKLPRKINIDFNLFKRGIVSGLLVGGGVMHAIHNKNYHHVPLPVLLPGAYTGYHTMKNIYQYEFKQTKDGVEWYNANRDN
tara:strand:+ start:2187 stop:2432 length:246 start_codon:yes stop_codon:yes gene_type:complete